MIYLAIIPSKTAVVGFNYVITDTILVNDIEKSLFLMKVEEENKRRF